MPRAEDEVLRPVQEVLDVVDEPPGGPVKDLDPKHLAVGSRPRADDGNHVGARHLQHQQWQHF